MSEARDCDPASQTKRTGRKLRQWLGTAALSTTLLAGCGSGTGGPEGAEPETVGEQTEALEVAPAAPTVIEQGAGFQEIRVDSPAYRVATAAMDPLQPSTMKVLAPSVLASLKGSTGTPLGTDGAALIQQALPDARSDVIVVDTLAGLKASKAPSWLKRKVLASEGFTDWSQVSAARLVAPMDRYALNMTAIYGLYVTAKIHKRIRNGDFLPQNWFSDRWQDVREGVGGFFEDAAEFIIDEMCPSASFERNVSQARQFGESRTQIDDFSAGTGSSATADQSQGVTGKVDWVHDMNGSVSLDADVELTTQCFLPTRVKVKKATIKADVLAGGDIGVAGSAQASYFSRPFHQELTILQGRWSFPIWYLYFTADLSLRVDYGVVVNAMAKADFDVGYHLGGPASFEWQCEDGRCRQTKSDTSGLGFTVKKNTASSLSASVEVSPYVDLYVAGDLNLYYVFDVAYLKGGIVAGLPVRYDGYVGNTCSDANGDGTSEKVSANLLDVSAQMVGYLYGELGSLAYKDDIELKIPGFKTRRMPVSFYLDGRKDRFVLTKSLYFNDLGGPSNIFDPVINTGDLASKKTLSFEKRSCQPYVWDEPTVEVDWGDGSANYVGPGKNLTHAWPTAGAQYAVRARVVSDSAGRAINGNWVSRTITAPSTSTTTTSSTTAGATTTASATECVANANKICSDCRGGCGCAEEQRRCQLLAAGLQSSSTATTPTTTTPTTTTPTTTTPTTTKSSTDLYSCAFSNTGCSVAREGWGTLPACGATGGWVTSCAKPDPRATTCAPVTVVPMQRTCP